jgi:hypothetical protein
MNNFSVLAIISLFAISCKDDEGPTSTSLIGSWKETSITRSACGDPLENGTENCSAPNCLTLVFTETTVAFDSDIYPYTKNGNSLTVMLDDIFTMNATYSISGSTLTLTVEGSPTDGICKEVFTFTRM